MRAHSQSEDAPLRVTKQLSSGRKILNMFLQRTAVSTLVIIWMLRSVAFGQSAASPRILQMTVSNMTGIVFQSEADRDYELEYSTDQQTWNSAKITVHGDGSLMTVFDAAGQSGGKFYRLMPIGVVPDPGLSFEAESGQITAPFSIADGAVSQPPDSGTTTPSSGGRAGYNFNVTEAGDYKVKIVVDAPHAGSDSLYVNIDAEPVPGNSMIWDIMPLTSGFEERTVSWRGNGTFSAPEFPEKAFTLSAGNHELIIRGREGGTKIDRIVIEKVEIGRIDGACGSASGGAFATPPSSGLCDSGTASAVVRFGAGYLWTCAGLNGGSTVSCAAWHDELPPDAHDSSLTMMSNISLNGQVIATDQNGDLLIYALQDDVTQGSLQFNFDGSFTYTPDPGYIGADAFTFYANDGQANSSLAVVDIAVNNASQTGNAYWVSPSGTSTWAECRSQSPLDGEAACSVITANDNAEAGDTINLRRGTYQDVHIDPVNSGTAESRIIWLAFDAEKPVFTGSQPMKEYDFFFGVLLNGVDYHIIDGVEVYDSTKLLVMNYGADYNEVRNCVLHKGNNFGNSGLAIKDNDMTFGGSTHNWVHHNTIYNGGHINASCSIAANIMKIGNSGDDFLSHHNTIENNVVYHGGHHVIETYTERNVIRNNVVHNEGWMSPPGGCGNQGRTGLNGLYGNRNIQINDSIGRSAMHNLIEGNRIGHADAPYNANGADGLSLVSRQNIARYNVIYNSGEKNIHLKQMGSGSDSDNNRIYNNIAYTTRGVRSNSYGLYIASGSTGNVIVNNILYDSAGGVDIGPASRLGAINTAHDNWFTGNGDPRVVDPDMTDYDSSALPDLSLQTNSAAIDAGVHLTIATATGSGSTLMVDDALFFQDGSWGSALSSIEADWIAIGTVDNVVQISAIDYSANAITLASPTSWSENDRIWLYKKSDSVRVLIGPAPDLGAHEHE
jgi:hypothetical protein